MKELTTDVLIIGGGGAAGCAAVEAAKYGVTVTLMDKGRFGRSGSTPVSASAFSAPLGLGGKPDSPEQHLQDVLRVSEGLCDIPLVKACIGDAPQILSFLEDIGVPLQKDAAGNYHQSRAMGHSVPRNITFDYQISDPMTVLRREAAHRGVFILDGVMATKLLRQGGGVSGVIGLSSTGEMVVVKAKAVILAAGSATMLYPYRSAIFPTTGDAVALAAEAGAELVDLEFAELTLIPVVNGVAVSTGGIGTMVRSGARYLNRLGERFMEKWDPVHLEAAPRYKVVRALYEEISQGRGPVTCNLEQVEQNVLDGPGHGNLALVHKRRAAGIGTVHSSFAWGIAIHRLLGGCSTDETTATTVKGLFAAGESAGGVHGAARLAGQAVLEFLTMGARAGKHAARLARQVSQAEPDREAIQQEEQRWQQIAENRGGVSPRKVIQEVQEIMGSYVSVSREGKGLQTAVQRLEEIVHEDVPRIGGKKLREAMEAANLSKTGWLVARAALERRESRGSHWRADYPERDDSQWLTHIAFRREGEGMAMATRPVIK